MYIYIILTTVIQFIMKNYILITLIFIGTTVYAQCAQQSKFETKGDLISATYFHDNGAIQQEGTFDKKGKLDGLWISYNENGVKLSQGNYDKGLKTGKWFFWTEESLKEVDYIDSRITNVNEWSSTSELATNFK